MDRYTLPGKEYLNSDILKSMLIGILCGNADFEATHETDDDLEYFCSEFHMRHLPSEAIMNMDLERFPSGKFDTNELVLELAMSTYNILRMIGGREH